LDWKKHYNDRLVSVEEAVGYLESGDHISMHSAANEPITLIDAMLERSDLKDVSITHIGSNYSPYCKPKYDGKFRLKSFFPGPARVIIDAVNDGRADLIPLHLTDIPRYYKTYNPPDVTMIHVTPPNEEGYVSLGISLDYADIAVENTKRLVIAEVNKQQSFTMGDNRVHVSKIDYFVESDRPLIHYPMPAVGEVEEKIGQNVASLINDGDCLQLGFGSIPDAILKYLEDKKDLGIHSEMFSDKIVGLYEAGVITGNRKNIDRGKIVVSFIVGSQRVYDFAHNNPAIRMKNIEYVNDPYVIGQIDNMISINSCIQVDLLGQAASDTIGYMQFSGTGGQVDFIRGAARSKGGKAILAIPSTAKGDKISRIVPLLDEGAAVTTSRYDVQYIVTEYGVASLRFKTRAERVRELVNIAHPKFREELLSHARQHNWI